MLSLLCCGSFRHFPFTSILVLVIQPVRIIHISEELFCLLVLNEKNRECSLPKCLHCLGLVQNQNLGIQSGSLMLVKKHSYSDDHALLTRLCITESGGEDLDIKMQVFWIWDIGIQISALSAKPNALACMSFLKISLIYRFSFFLHQSKRIFQFHFLRVYG